MSDSREYSPHRPTDPTFDTGCCKAAVLQVGGWHSYQCSRKHIKEGWCKQHHPDTCAERERKARERCEADLRRRQVARGLNKAERRVVEAAMYYRQFNCPEAWRKLDAACRALEDERNAAK